VSVLEGQILFSKEVIYKNLPGQTDGLDEHYILLILFCIILYYNPMPETRIKIIKLKNIAIQ
jgi:hypothetical protein